MAGSHPLNGLIRRHGSMIQKLEKHGGCSKRRQNIPEYLETLAVACHVIRGHYLVPPLGETNARQHAQAERPKLRDPAHGIPSTHEAGQAAMIAHPCRAV